MIKRTAIAAVGLALVASAIVGGVVGSQLGASASPDPPNPGHDWSAIGLPEGTWPDLDADRVDGLEAADLLPPHGGRLIELGTVEVPPATSVEYSMVDVRDCASLYAMFRASDDLGSSHLGTPGAYPIYPDGSTRAGVAFLSGHLYATYDGVSTTSAYVGRRVPYVQPVVYNQHDTITTNATGWLWCAW